MLGRTVVSHVGAVLALAAVPLAACGSSDAPAAIPTAEELAAQLLVPGDLAGTWTVNLGPAEQGGGSGVVSEEQQDQLPRFEFCDEAGAAAQQADAELHWLAFRQLDFEADDPIDPPGDRTGHMAFVQEYLTSGDPDELQATFELLRDGAAACYGDIPAGEEGPGTAGPLTIPDFGEARFGARLTFEEAGGWAEWHLSYAVVRDGPTLMSVVVTDITAGTEPLWSIDDLATIFRTAAAKT